MDKPRRGRPVGTSPNRMQDQPLLKEAARRIVFFGCRTATEAFRELAAEEEQAGRIELGTCDALVRRLQRRWEQDGAKLLDAHRAELAAVYDFRERGLKAEMPELHRKLEKFSNSPEGQAILAACGVGGRPVHLMALGIQKAWEHIQMLSPVGSAAAEEAFQPTFAFWSRFGIEPDAAFLNRMAELCRSKAAELGGDDAATDGALAREQTA